MIYVIQHIVVGPMHINISSLRKYSVILLKILCAWCIITDFIYSWFMFLLSIGSCNIITGIVIAFVTRNMGIAYAMTSKNSLWNKYFAFWNLLLVIGFYFLYDDIKRNLFCFDDFTFYPIPNGVSGLQRIDTNIVPSLMRSSCYIYTCYCFWCKLIRL